jgi:hypothetical protein
MEYLSLYDYLGKAAGNDLGKEVASAAYQAGVKMQEREISNPKYTGIVHLYPKDFLDFYFREPESNLIDELPGADEWQMSISDRQDYEDDLPF